MKRILKWAAIAIIGLVVLVAILPKSDTPEPVASGPTVESSPAAPLPPWEEIKAFRETATDVQWNAYNDGLKGAAMVDWPGTLTDVTLQESQSGNEYLVNVDFGDGGISEVMFWTDNADVANWPKDTPVRISGTVDYVQSALGEVTGIELEDGATIAQS